MANSFFIFHTPNLHIYKRIIIKYVHFLNKSEKSENMLRKVHMIAPIIPIMIKPTIILHIISVAHSGKINANINRISIACPMPVHSIPMNAINPCIISLKYH